MENLWHPQQSVSANSLDCTNHFLGKARFARFAVVVVTTILQGNRDPACHHRPNVHDSIRPHFPLRMLL